MAPLKIYQTIFNEFIKKVKLPVTYILFLVICFMMYYPEHSFSSVDSNTSTLKLINLLFAIFSIVYGNLWITLGTMITAEIAIYLLFRFDFFNREIFQNKSYTGDGLIEEWNAVSAKNRIGNIISKICLQYYVYYLLLYGLKNNFYSLRDKVLSDYIIQFLFLINIVYFMYLIIKILFIIRIPSSQSYSSTYAFESEYLIINKNSDSSVLLCKSKFTNLYVLVDKEVKVHTPDNGPINQSSTYKIIDSSNNLSDIVYHFDCKK
ncbi:hypothetical protein R4Y45_04370 [Holzapfeliella sp. He02]|uniref:Uncharacterized protein n=1 Tax=Holzapfeliella saturejae TaxID=3082953 RepID=A0ABU8SGG0_9LACO